MDTEEFIPRAALSCDVCLQSAIVKMRPNASREEIDATVWALHAQISPECRAPKLQIKYFDYGGGLDRSMIAIQAAISAYDRPMDTEQFIPRGA